MRRRSKEVKKNSAVPIDYNQNGYSPLYPFSRTQQVSLARHGWPLQKIQRAKGLMKRNH